MPTQTERRDISAVERPAQRAAMVLGLYVLTGGLISFLGWMFNIRRLTDWLGNDVSIQPNAAVAAIFVGFALCCANRYPRASITTGAVAGFIGATALFENFTLIDLHIDTVFTFDRLWGRGGTTAPGRMGLPGSVSWTLLGIAFVMMGRGVHARRLVASLGILVAFIASISLIGILYGADTLFMLPRVTSIATQTATFLFAAALGVLAAVPEREPVRTLFADSSGGILTRRSLPFIIVVPILLGYIRVRGQQLGLYDTAMGTAMLVLILVVLLCTVLWRGVTMVAARERTLKAAELALRDADRQKNEFLATLAHELRNPLAPLANSLELLAITGGSPVHLDQIRASMERQVQHMVRLIDDLMDISRITHNRLELRMQSVNLTNIVQQSVDEARPMIERNEHTLHVEIPTEPIMVCGDHARLAQVLDNLLRNANRYTKRGGTICVRLEKQGTEAIMTVSDTGVGIPPNMLEWVFHPFTQVDRSIERSQGGLGIGLSLVKRLVELHKGHVKAESDGAGKGSTFIVTLPAEHGTAGLATAAPAPFSTRDALSANPVTPTSSRRILVVDDNRDAADSLAMVLQMEQHVVQTTYDGLEALSVAEKFRPHVILLDIGLPGMHGYDVCRAIRAEPWGHGIVIVAITGWGHEDDRRTSKTAGFDAHFVKPVEHGVLMEFLSPLLV